MAQKKPWWGEGLSIFDGADEDVAKLPLIVRKYMAFEKVLNEMPIRIDDSELIVGNMVMSSSGLGRFFPDYATEAEKQAAVQKSLSIRSVWGHSVPDYPKALNRGLIGIIKEAKERREQLSVKDPEAEEKNSFYEAVIGCCNAVIAFARRYAQLADQSANRESDQERKSELKVIARICRLVPDNPAQSFHQALQSVWFIHIALHNTLNWSPLGRLDQYLYPFFQNDLQNGLITKTEAQELLDCFWIKFSERMQIKPAHFEDHRDPTDYSFGRDPESDMTFPSIDDQAYVNQWLQTCVLGGQTPSGSDATNDLTYMCLDATEKMQMTQPTVLLRLHRKSPRPLIEKACEVIRSGGGMPVICNDETRLPHLLKAGIPLKEARNYCVSGCWEMKIPGKTEFRWIPIHSLKCIEWVFTGGANAMDGRKHGLDTGDITDLETFGDIMAAFRRQLDQQIRIGFEETVKWYGCNYMIAPDPFLSCLMDDCLETGKDVTQGGAKYIFYPFFVTGLPNAVDSLAAIRKLVFEDKALTLAELKEAMATNFKGYENLKLRLSNTMPKYGTDDDIVDQLAIDITAHFVQQVKKQTAGNSTFTFPVAIGTTPLYVVFGKSIGATPDGRGAGEPLATNFSPVAGAARNGVTAAIKSFTKMPYSKLGIDSELDVDINPEFVKGEEGLSALAWLIESFMDLEGTILTVSIVSIETLRHAQEQPELYRNLRVRLGGWQAFFVALNREHQDTHIKRVEHGGL